MSADYGVIAPLEREILEDLPELLEKAVVDAVNGLEVLEDRLRWRDENPGSVLSRIWAGWTGGTARRQQAVDRSVQGVLNGMNEWLRALHEAQYESDIVIKRVADKLLETCQFVNGLKAQHRALQSETAALGRRLDEYKQHTDGQLSELREALKLETAGRRAWNAVEYVESRWRSNRYDAVPPLLRTVLAANDLYWGDFGAFLRHNGTEEKETRKLGEHARDKLGSMAQSFAATEWQGAAPIEDWLDSLEDTTISEDWRDAAVYLLDGSPSDVQPLSAAVAARLQGRNDAFPDALPRLARPAYLGELAVRGVVRRIEAERDEQERNSR